MKRIIVMLFTLLISASAFAQELPRIAVCVIGDMPENEKKAFGTRMLTPLLKSGRYSANSFFSEIGREKLVQHSGGIDSAQVRALGNQLGVRQICVVEAIPIFGEYQVTARVIDAETAASVAVGQASGPLKSVGDLELISESIVRDMFGKSSGSALAVTMYTLTTNAAPAGAGFVSRTPNQSRYEAGTMVSITANPADGYRFVGWSGAITSANPTVKGPMNGDMTLTANFELVPAPVSPPVSAGGGAGWGAAQPAQAQAYYPAGSAPRQGSGVSYDRVNAERYNRGDERKQQKNAIGLSLGFSTLNPVSSKIARKDFIFAYAPNYRRVLDVNYLEISINIEGGGNNDPDGYNQFAYASFGIFGFYLWNWSIDDVYSWYVGPGIGFGYSLVEDYWDFGEGSYFNIGGQIGIERKINIEGNIFAVSFDVRPMYRSISFDDTRSENTYGGSDFNFVFAVKIKWIF